MEPNERMRIMLSFMGEDSVPTADTATTTTTTTHRERMNPTSTTGRPGTYPGIYPEQNTTSTNFQTVPDFQTDYQTDFQSDSHRGFQTDFQSNSDFQNDDTPPLVDIASVNDTNMGGITTDMSMGVEMGAILDEAQIEEHVASYCNITGSDPESARHLLEV